MAENICGLIYDPVFADHVTGTGHLNSPSVPPTHMKHCKMQGLPKKCDPLPANFCKEESLALVHHPEYLKIAKKDTKSGRSTLSTGDTQICEDSWDISLRATGGLLHALDQIFAGKMDPGLFPFPSSGSSCHPIQGNGLFCLFNHIAIAAVMLKRNIESEKF